MRTHLEYFRPLLFFLCALFPPLCYVIVNWSNATLGTLDPDSDQYLEMICTTIGINHSPVGIHKSYIPGCIVRPYGYPMLVSHVNSISNTNLINSILLSHLYLWILAIAILVLGMPANVKHKFAYLIIIFNMLLMYKYSIIVSTEWALYCLLICVVVVCNTRLNIFKALLLSTIFGIIITIRPEYLPALAIVFISWLYFNRKLLSRFILVSSIFPALLVININSQMKATYCGTYNFKFHLAQSLYHSTRSIRLDSLPQNLEVAERIDNAGPDRDFFVLAEHERVANKNTLSTIADQTLQLAILKIKAHPASFISIIFERVFYLFPYFMLPLLVFSMLRQAKRYKEAKEQLPWFLAILTHSILVSTLNVGIQRYIEPVFYAYLTVQIIYYYQHFGSIIFSRQTSPNALPN